MRSSPLVSIALASLCLLGLFSARSEAALANSLAIATGSYGLNAGLGLTQISIPPPTASTTSTVLYIFDAVLNSSNGNDANGYVDIMAYTPSVSPKIDELMRNPKSGKTRSALGKLWDMIRGSQEAEVERVSNDARSRSSSDEHRLGTPAPPPTPFSIDRVLFSVNLLCGTPYDPRIAVQQTTCQQLTSYANLEYCESNFMVEATSSGPFTRNIGLSNGNVAFSLYSFLGGSWSYFFECQSNCNATFTNVCNLPSA